LSGMTESISCKLQDTIGDFLTQRKTLNRDLTAIPYSCGVFL
jgi:hypothetical protein